MLLRYILAKCYGDQFDPTCNCIGAIVRYSYHRLAILITVFDVIDRIAERAGRALLYCFNDRFCTCSIWVNPRLLIHPEH